MTVEKFQEAARETLEHLETMTGAATELARWWHLRGFTEDRWLHFAASVWRGVQREEDEKRMASK